MSAFDWNKLDSMTGIRSNQERPPESSITIYDYCSQKKVGRTAAQSALQNLVSKGIMKRGKFWSSTRNKWMAYYWFAEDKSGASAKH